jgi:hypothetical protein
MKTIETKATITKDQVLIVPLPINLTPGEVAVVVVIEERAEPTMRRPRIKLRAHDVGLASPGLTFRREDLYDNGQPGLH